MKTRMKICLCILACLLCLGLGAGIGSLTISPREIFQILTGRLEGVKASILMSIRIPRVLMAFLVGAALSASGTVMQSVLRNPLASSYTLGVSSGASLLADALTEHAGHIERAERLYRAKTRAMRAKLYAKQLKAPFMYNRVLRNLILRSGLRAVKLQTPCAQTESRQSAEQTEDV